MHVTTQTYSGSVNRVDLIVDDVEGDWLEQWGEEETVVPKATSDKTREWASHSR